MLNSALIGSTWDTVVMTVDVLTRLPTCSWAIPAMPERGEVTCVHPWFELRLGEIGAGRADVRLRFELGRDVIVELLLRDELPRDQLPVALHVEPRFPQGRDVSRKASTSHDPTRPGNCAGR